MQGLLSVDFYGRRIISEDEPVDSDRGLEDQDLYGDPDEEIDEAQKSY